MVIFGVMFISIKRRYYNQIYAIKYELDRYNNLEVLNIKNINPILDNNYRRYGYTPSMVKMSLLKRINLITIKF